LEIGRIIFFLSFVPSGEAFCVIESEQDLEVDSEFPDPLSVLCLPPWVCGERLSDPPASVEP